VNDVIFLKNFVKLRLIKTPNLVPIKIINYHSHKMNGNKEIRTIQKSLPADELTAINQYRIQSDRCADLGYRRLFKAMQKQAMDEMLQAGLLPESDDQHQVNLLTKILKMEDGSGEWTDIQVALIV